MPQIHIAPSILSADFRILEREIKMAEDAGADRIHCDVMDGHFVPNITFGPLVIEAVRKSTKLPLDVHLMIADPAKYVDAFCKAGADILMVHAEACNGNVAGVLDAIAQHSVKTGVAVNPDKSIDLFAADINKIDQILIMTVYAGFGGQSFMHEMLPKIAQAREETKKISRSIDIEVDGGINGDTAKLCAKAGANVFVAGNFIFGSTDYHERTTLVRAGALQGQGL